MPALILVLYRFFRGIWNGLKDPEFRGLFYWVGSILALGTWFYARVEGWTWLDSLYFSVTTLTTVGYGDLAPQTAAGKIFTIFYILVGLGFLSGFVILLAERSGIFKPAGKPAKPANIRQDPVPGQGKQ
jgi:voltage-gated potassium channel